MDKNVRNYGFNSTQIIISENSVNYLKAIKYMENRVKDIIENNSSDLIWLLSHPSIYTYGMTSKKSDFLKGTSIPIIRTNRGGQITYHGPGQRIIYFMINLNNKKKDIRNFINILEKIIIKSLLEFNVISESRKDRIGIWVTEVNNKKLEKEKKIGAIGLRIKKWVSYHGISVNINTNLKYFSYINPCGIKKYGVTSLKDLGVIIEEKKFDEVLLKYCKKYLNN